MMIADCNHHHQHQQRAQQQVTTSSTTMLPSATNTNQRASNAAPMRHQHQLSSPQSNSCHQELHQHHMQQQQHYGHHEAHQAPQMHYIEANNNSHHPQSQHNNHDQRQQQQQTSIYPPQQQQIYTRPMGQQQQPQQLGQHLHLPASVNAPPTPPSDDQLQRTVYLAPQDSRQQQHSNKLQTGAWVMQTIQMQQQQQQQQQQHHNELHDSAPVGQQPSSTISSYYYDIDDGFSDILSAPATPEPVQIIDQSHNQQQPLNDNYQPGYTSNYISYNTDDSNQRQQRTMVGNNVQLDFENHHNHHHHQQQHHSQHHHHLHQQQQHFYPSQVQQCNRLTMAQVPYTVAMSPDSSSLSTTSSSPSDHSLYQASPPMAGCGLVKNNGLLQAAGPIQSVQQQQQLKSHYPTHLLPLSPAANVKSPSNEQTFSPVSQPQQTMSATANPSQVILKPINNSLQTSVRPLAQQPHPNQLHHHQHHHHRSSPIHLWEFLKELLQQVEAGSADSTIIRWLDRQRGVFKIEDSVRVAKLWGKRKNKPKMNYDKLSRSIRQYYKKGIMKKTDRSQRLVYQFCSAYCH